MVELEDWTVDIPIPERIRKRGSIPDLRLLSPGDLFLFSDADEKPRSIRVGQMALGYLAAEARWQHAAIYLGGGLAVLESVTDDGVSVNAIYDKVCVREFRVRRSVSKDDHLGLMIAQRALAYLEMGYGWKSLVLDWGGELLGKAQRERDVETTCAVYCSELFVRSHDYLAPRPIVEKPNQMMCPALLSRTSRLVDVDVPWRRIA